MSTNFSVIGGDLRIIKLAKMLAEDGNNVYTYGMEKAEELKENNIECEFKDFFDIVNPKAKELSSKIYLTTIDLLLSGLRVGYLIVRVSFVIEILVSPILVYI